MKKTLALLLALVMVVGMFAGCAKNEPAATTPVTEGTAAPAPVADDAEYTYNDSVPQLASNWNIHTYETSDDAYPIDVGGITSGFYTFFFNDELHPVEGKEPYSGYKIVPEMAVSEPVDVTEQIKAEHPEFNIPEGATKGYAYTIDLNPDACWDDGTPIKAVDYVESMKRLLDPKLVNYRAADYYADSFCVANAEQYANSGRTVYVANNSTGDDAGYTYAVADLTLNDQGVYVNADGETLWFPLDADIAWCGASLAWCADNGYLPAETYEALAAKAEGGDGKRYVPVTEETLALMTEWITSDGWGNEPAENTASYMSINRTYPEFPFENVGLYESGEYQITLVLGKSLAGFQLLYNLSGNWLVKTDMYDACLQEKDGMWTNSYCTSAETTPSYGPYKMTSYQTDKAMKFEKNENWWGYTDGKHTYVDPTDGETYNMYQTTVIDTQVVAEAETRKLMFLKGELMGYGLQPEDFATYRNSEYCYATPKMTLFFMILNGHKGAIAQREGAADFDQSKFDLETVTLESFRRAMAVCYDRDLFCATISPARAAGYGIISDSYIYDPISGAKYRDTEQAKKVLCDFYSVDTSKFANLDEAVDSITGFDAEAAKVLFQQAFDEALAAGFITDADNDGKCDQTIQLEYNMSADSDFMTKTVNYLAEKANEGAMGTPFEGKITVVKSAPYGNEWSNKVKQGMSDLVLAGWTGSALNPFGLTDLYVNPAKQYDAAWFNSETVDVTLDVDVAGIEAETPEVKTITMNLHQWSDALNGTTVEINGESYNFGDGIANVETRLDILAAIEAAVLRTYDYLPMMVDGSMALLSQKAFYVVEEYNPIMYRGGIQYMKYNYNDAEWAAYVTEQGGQLTY